MGYTIIIAMGIPTAVTAFCFWLIERKIASREKVQDERESERIQMQLLLMDSVNASIALGEATVLAIERIPDTHCNGEMKAALKEANEARENQRKFIEREGIKKLYEEG